MDLSLEELAEIRITSVTRHASELGKSAAAVYVITGEDMRRSGYTSIADALRMVPGMQVARTGGASWAIGARGFSSVFSNKQLVMIDGRSVYSPLFSGVFWDIRDVPVADIDRIEVIRGPGATLWGANAVNGVINIITRRAATASGWTLEGGGGTEERAFGTVRYGGALGTDADYRITASGFQRDDLHNREGPDDEWWLGRVQGRADWMLGERDTVTFTSEFFEGEVDQQRSRAVVAAPLAPEDNERGHRLGGSALGRWKHELEGGSELTSHLWYEYTDLEFTTLREQRHTVDLDVQHHSRPFDRHEVVWGGAYRFSYDEIGERGLTTLDPSSRGIHLATGFLQDQITLVRERADLTLGSKFEYNEFTGFEVQPSARLSVTPNDWNTLWGAVSRAVRTPTRLEDDADLGVAVLPPGPPPVQDPTRPTLFVLRGNERFDSEKVTAYEGGYRVRPHENVNLDVAAFYNDYEDLLTAEVGSLMTVPAMGGDPEYVVFPLVIDNELGGHSYGVEVAAWWQVLPRWRLHASYSYIDIHLEPTSGGSDLASEALEDSSARNLVHGRSTLDLPYGVQLDAILRYVDRISALDVDSYIEMDVRLAWAFAEGWEAAVVGQNLLHDHHQEAAGPDRVQRGVYGQLRWRFGEGR
jgi:iron complex outermembrane receptor protein